MKKLAIAGASLALAAMPVVGVFADDITTVKDTIQVTVSSFCRFGASTSGTVNPSIATEKDNTYSQSGQAPGALVELGSTTLAIECNDAHGYQITPSMTSLTDTDASDGTGTAITFKDGTDAAANDGKWSAAYSGAATGNFTSGTAITGSSSMTDTYTISYKVGLGADQEAATYQGTATYVLAAQAGN